MKKGNILLIILVVIGIISVSVGGYFWWTTQKPKGEPTPIVETKPKEASPSADETVKWKTYTNLKAGFSIKVPNSYKFRDFGWRSGFSEATPSGTTPTKGVDFFLGYVTALAGADPNGFQPCTSDDQVYNDIYKSLTVGDDRFRLIQSLIVNKEIRGILVYLVYPESELGRYWIKYNICHDGKDFTFDFQPFGYTNETIEDFKINVVDQILSTFKFLDQAPTTQPIITPDSKKRLAYLLPSGWKTVQDKTGAFELGYDPEKGYVFNPDSIRDLSIGLTQKGPYGGQYFSLMLRTYNGGSRHKFIFPENFTLTSGDKMAGYHEREYLYNGWSCLVLYGISVSQWPSTEGMCAVNSSQALWFATWMEDADVEKIISTIKLLK